MNLLFIILVLLVLFSFLSFPKMPRSLEPCIGCHGAYEQPDMCSRLAAETCRVAQPQLEDCWLQHYQDCVSDGRGGSSCNCADFASSKCQADNAVGEACYAQFRAKCLATQGLGVDPDRGRGSATH